MRVEEAALDRDPGRDGALLEALRDPKHPEHDEYRLWVGESFDPERFDAAQVRFEDPAKRLREVYDFT